MSDNKRQKVEALYKEYGSIILGHLKKGRLIKKRFVLQEDEADDVCQETFRNVLSNIVFVIGGKMISRRGQPILKEKAWLLKIAENTANSFIEDKIRSRGEWDKNRKQNDADAKGESKWSELAPKETLKWSEKTNSVNELESPAPSPAEIVDKHKQKACIRKCYRTALEKPHAIFPLVVALCELECPIEEIAKVINRTEPETEKLLKKCHNEMKTLKKARGERCSRFPRDKGILERCREEKAGYKDYYNDYETKHSHQEGKGSLYLLLFELTVRDWDIKEIADLINKEKRTTERAWKRALNLIDEEVEKCLRQNCGL